MNQASSSKMPAPTSSERVMNYFTDETPSRSELFRTAGAVRKATAAGLVGSLAFAGGLIAVERAITPSPIEVRMITTEASCGQDWAQDTQPCNLQQQLD